jgi:hypothetical protein
MKFHALLRTFFFVVLAALTFWWAHENAGTVGRVAPWSLEFFKGLGACVALIFCIFHVTRGGLQRDLEDLVPRNPWHKAHALKSRIKRLERELAAARKEQAAAIAAARSDLDEVEVASSISP